MMHKKHKPPKPTPRATPNGVFHVSLDDTVVPGVPESAHDESILLSVSCVTVDDNTQPDLNLVGLVALNIGYFASSFGVSTIFERMYENTNDFGTFNAVDSSNFGSSIRTHAII